MPKTQLFHRLRRMGGLAPAMAAMLAATVAFAGGAQARDHSFHIPHRPHAPSPYGNVTGYEPVQDKKSPEYIKTAQVCETTSAMGMYATTTAKQMSMNRTDHRRFYAQCMVSHGAWRSLSLSAGGDMGGDDNIR
ncbi:hypothetical protein CFR73_04355 [Novacetimonas maltaceti]|uniref:Uncharacterized protein n=1 Tax=Novacetimonas maltaceti TaxID=1203393 RepID=A0A2S3W388_9PROT|nr:hypothetical protein [Novacetimonas maltaceti]POF63287.1 hypothetical protein KMAL_10180 [Novacetimonas maltaceti]PYD61291.1 hypothetical protein CFR73_04355 [Novacetimonas maltaceti]